MWCVGKIFEKTGSGRHIFSLKGGPERFDGDWDNFLKRRGHPKKGHPKKGYPKKGASQKGEAGHPTGTVIQGGGWTFRNTWEQLNQGGYEK